MVTAHYVQKVELDNSYSIQVFMSIAFRGGKFVEVFRTKQQPLCDFVQSHGPKIKDIPENICPFPPMEISLDHEEFNAEPVLAKLMPGKFKIESFLTQGGVEKVHSLCIVEMK